MVQSLLEGRDRGLVQGAAQLTSICCWPVTDTYFRTLVPICCGLPEVPRGQVAS